MRGRAGSGAPGAEYLPTRSATTRVVGDQTACLTPRPDGRDFNLKPLDVWTVPDPPTHNGATRVQVLHPAESGNVQSPAGST
jgi:hypothetical protein